MKSKEQTPEVYVDEDWDEPSLAQIIAERRGERELNASGRRSFREEDSTADSDESHSNSASCDEDNNCDDDEGVQNIVKSEVETYDNKKQHQNEQLQQKSQLAEKRTVKRASHKSRPREMPSNRPVPVGRDACLGISSIGGGNDGSGRSIRKFDPRFEEHCGDLRELHVERNYAFLGEQREQRRKELEEIAQRRDKQRKKKARAKVGNNLQETHEYDDVDMELDRMRQDDLRRESVLRKRSVLKQVIEEQKDAVRQGKKPMFLSRRALRERELRERFDQLKKQKGGVSKFIAKRRRKLVSKERKTMHAGSNQI